MQLPRRQTVSPALRLRAPALLSLLWLATGCEHAMPAAGAEPLPARLPPATPPAVAAPRVSLAPTPAAAAPATTFVLSDQARRFLTLQYGAFRTEFMGCMMGAQHGDTVEVERIAPADVEPRHSAATWVIPSQTCESAGWTGVVGTIHSHVEGQRCWYFFPGTAVATSDAEVFARARYPVDAIMCGDHVVWVGRQMQQRQVGLPAGPARPE